MTISKSFLRELIHGLSSALTLEELDSILQQELNRSLNDFAPGRTPREILVSLILTAEEEGWLPLLISAARRSHPYHPALVDISRRFGLSPTVTIQHSASTPRPASRQRLEKILRNNLPFLDPARWREQMARVEQQVCRIEIDLNPRGTGFLIAPEWVMTAYHVVQEIHEGKISPRQVRVRFQHLLPPHQAVPAAGDEFALSKDWLVDWSPPSPAEEVDAEEPLPTPEEMDYAILQLAQPAGLLPVSSAVVSSPPRGWISLPVAFPVVNEADPLLIVQHPLGAPLKIALDTQGILGWNVNRTRLLYRTNTQAGSSGSPCFTLDWQIIALHQRRLNGANQGCSLEAIARLLQERNISLPESLD
ncbi:MULTISPECIES: trypsin-like peptidase domain-containing protein [Anaerolinea]|uniref:trypsin-like peptidase domain-containing protein n=1 Tax=Anaerolinea TaxID=233189 RepID=UPI00261CF514|nr:trypsin-like peptidase domain-containing protein [Anaerolinea thermophila]